MRTSTRTRRDEGKKREEIEEEEGEGGLHELARRRVEYLDDLLDSVF